MALDPAMATATAMALVSFQQIRLSSSLQLQMSLLSKLSIPSLLLQLLVPTSL
jgi:hypothetical protein